MHLQLLTPVPMKRNLHVVLDLELVLERTNSDSHTAVKLKSYCQLLTPIASRAAKKYIENKLGVMQLRNS